jgi:parallel beta-helix repeat protein
MSVAMSSTRPWKSSGHACLPLLVSALLIAAACQPSFAEKKSCVKPGGKAGCYATIAAAVAAASPGDEISVEPGTYKEAVVIGKSLSLIGTNRHNTIIDATGLANGVYVDGLDNPGLRDVVVAGFTIENAKFEGVLVTNASDVTIRDNHVLNNDTSLNIDIPLCPGQPSFETGEDFDCGEGIHLTGVAYSTVADNIVEDNSGGILLSDETGETHDNFLTRNTVRDNPFDCGITLASHAPSPGSTAPHLGIVHNIILANQSTRNGFQVPGAGAGVGIFSDGSGIGKVTGNIVLNNQLKNNGIPGIAVHSHVGPNFGLPADNLNDNVFIGNQISGNGADIGDTPTPGPAGINISSGFGGTPITGSVISGNTIAQEAADVVVGTPAEVDLHFNNLLGGQIGVANLGPGTVNATRNYWGCFAGPGSSRCSSVSGPGVTYVPFLRVPLP